MLCARPCAPDAPHEVQTNQRHNNKHTTCAKARGPRNAHTNELAQTTHNKRAQLTRDGQQQTNDIIDETQ